MYITKKYYGFSSSFISSLQSGVNKDQTKLKSFCHVWKIFNILFIKIEKKKKKKKRKKRIPQVVPTPSAYENSGTTFLSLTIQFFNKEKNYFITMISRCSQEQICSLLEWSIICNYLSSVLFCKIKNSYLTNPCTITMHDATIKVNLLRLLSTKT